MPLLKQIFVQMKFYLWAKELTQTHHQKSKPRNNFLKSECLTDMKTYISQWIFCKSCLEIAEEHVLIIYTLRKLINQMFWKTCSGVFKQIFEKWE